MPNIPRTAIGTLSRSDCPYFLVFFRSIACPCFLSLVFSRGSVVKQVDYAYDAFNRLVKRTYDADGAGSGAATNQYWVYDEGINAVLQFDGPAASDLTHRYLWTGVVDELMADDTIGSGADTLYALGDHLGTIPIHLKLQRSRFS